ncbi:uncharacterized protein LOC112552944 [Pogonomyrmex barbatus]|uniref:Uncharacterized protein LOC112552944 n=1 Tax=Pogonomyrmex barbatus TaxID=144034 RepID=A0A8N1S8V3_9HYME|nr:uncharacterized protein LOC112552944 [Pogonomyrmex barbatus]
MRLFASMGVLWAPTVADWARQGEGRVGVPRSTLVFIPNSAKRRNFVFGGGRRYGEIGGKGGEGEEGSNGEGSGTAQSTERSEREEWQFFKIKAVKPNLQVCRRKRIEVVKILVCCIRARNPSSPSVSPLFSFVPAFPRTLPTPFERRRSRRALSLPSRWLNCRTKRS